MSAIAVRAPAGRRRLSPLTLATYLAGLLLVGITVVPLLFVFLDGAKSNAQINTSACRGEKLMRSIPKRARSNRLAAVAMNSIAQHAVPNGIGHSEFARPQFTRKSSLVATQLSGDSGT